MKNPIKDEWISPDGNVRLILGDCYLVLRKLKVDSLDLVITDPPYLVGAGAGGGKFGYHDALVNTGGFTDTGFDVSLLNQFRNWQCFCSIKQLRDLMNTADNGDNFQVITWCKPTPAPTCNAKYLPDVEYIVHKWQRNRLFGGYHDKSSFVVCQAGRLGPRGGGKASDHPNEKPLPVVQKLLTLGSQAGDLVCDPFMGSGTTGVACILMGRRFIGIELDKKYFGVSVKRCQAAISKAERSFKIQDKSLLLHNKGFFPDLPKNKREARRPTLRRD